jgi:myo-inositol 2-dehydrogenase / D-chiro-inositol 1-dehydrogenase
MVMATEPLRVGVLGTGRIGRLHAEVVARQVPGATLAALYDADEASARSLGRRLGVPAASSAAAVIASSGVDAVAICTPTGLHAQQMIDAAHAGKAIFCEKPISLDLAQVDRALTAVAEAGVPFQVGFNQRFDPGHAAVAAAVAQGRVGEPQLVRMTSRDPAPPLDYARGSGGIFLDMTIHDFDMARHLVGSEVREVYAAGGVLVEPALAEFGDLDTVRAASTTRLCTTRSSTATRRATSPSGARSRAHCVTAAILRSVSKTPRAPIVIGLAAWRSVREHRPVQTAEITTTECLSSAQPTPSTTT